MAQPGFKKMIVTVPIESPMMIQVTCDAHNWMQGWWYVGGQSVLRGDRRRRAIFTITNVPPGTYTMRVWQEKLGTQTRR